MRCPCALSQTRKTESTPLNVATTAGAAADIEAQVEGFVTFLDADETAHIHTLTQPHTGALPVRPRKRAK